MKPYNDASWKTGPIHNKAELTEDLQKQLAAFPGVIFNYTQPAEDAVDEALTGLKSALAVKIYGPDLNVLQEKALEIKRRLSQVPGFTELTVVRELGQPSLLIDVGPRQDRALRHQRRRRGSRGAGGRRRPGGHAGDSGRKTIRPRGAHEAGIPRERRSKSAICSSARPPASKFPLSELADIHEASGASFIYRENNSRYIGVQYSIEGRDLQSAVDDGQRAIADIEKSLPAGYRSTGAANTANFSKRNARWKSSGRSRCC